jgi:hypothetical protein
MPHVDDKLLLSPVQQCMARPTNSHPPLDTPCQLAVAQHISGTATMGGMPRSKDLLRLAAGITSHASKLANRAEKRLESNETRHDEAHAVPASELPIKGLPMVRHP